MLERYAYLNNFTVEDPPYVPIEVNKPPTLILDDQSEDATRQQAPPNYSAFVTVHSLNDYRKKISSLLLIPDVTVEIDKLVFDIKEMAECTITL